MSPAFRMSASSLAVGVAMGGDWVWLGDGYVCVVAFDPPTSTVTCVVVTSANHACNHNNRYSQALQSWDKGRKKGGELES